MNNSTLHPTVGRMFMGLGMLHGFVEQARLSWRLFRDPRVPTVAKAIPVVTALYLISPVDWVVNLIPILGQMEDVAVIGLGMTLFIRAAPQDIVNQHLAEIRGTATVAGITSGQMPNPTP